MNMMIETLGMVGHSYIVWLAVAALAGSTVLSFLRWRRCPGLDHGKVPSEDQVAVARQAPFVPGPRFLVMMIGGISAMLAGLGMIAKSTLPELGFLLIVAGVYVVQTEPARLRLHEAFNRAIASRSETDGSRALAVDRLRHSHMWNLTINLAILFGVTAGLVAF